MKFNLNELYQIESGASYKKIYRYKHLNKGKIQSNLEIPRLDHMYIGNKIL